MNDDDENTSAINRPLEGITERESDRIVAGALELMSAITDAYGREKGLELWESISDTLGTEIKGALFIALITGQTAGGVTMHAGPCYANSRVEVIKLVRWATGMGLKEAKDVCDAAQGGTPQRLALTKTQNRSDFCRAMSQHGVRVT